MWLFNTKNAVTFVSTWAQLFSTGFWLVGVLGPLSVLTYLTFYRILIPQETAWIPVEAMELIGNWKDLQYSVDISKLLYQFKRLPDLDYEISLELEILCNRNRDDDVYPIVAMLAYPPLPPLPQVNVLRQFILNCDARNVYLQHNRLVPYNLRFWVSPILTSLNKNVNIKLPLLNVNARTLIAFSKERARKDGKDLTLRMNKSVILHEANSRIVFTIQWVGFRYYLCKYKVTSFVIGVAVFWGFAAFIASITAMSLFMVSEEGKPKYQFQKDEIQIKSTDEEFSSGDIKSSSEVSVKKEPGA